jgi:hypothetical protein
MMTKEYLNELVTNLKNKFHFIEQKMINAEREEANFRASLMNSVDKKINEMVNNFKETHQRIINEEKNLFKKQIEDAENKTLSYSKSLEWYKAQITELYPFKQKYNLS